MAAPQIINNLIERFTQNISSYSASTYNEAPLRQEFINPFFEALGWDVSNKQGHAEAYKEVIHEDAVKIGTATKAPDYSFRVGGTRKFFVEAKRPFVNIKDDISPAFQLRRYAWSAKLPLSILTDFEEFAVYDCRLKPVKTDKASIGRVLYITYDEYEKRWDEIASIFSKDSVLKGSFDRYAETSKSKRGTTEVDDAFLAEIESWRDMLARNIAIRNENLSMRELNFAVQRTIDRLIFLRICEDRGIEEYGRLQAHLNGENIYKRLCVLFREADERYNSGIFHFREEKTRKETPDNITLKLEIDDKVLKQIIQNLYYPDSAYEFSVLPADILGQVYEQFLGKVIRLTAGHQAKVEDKPEVKKAGGVFYTPTYIVNYIVQNSVGKLLEGKTPKQATALRILDPACGSGSFLIGAYQYLLDWHRDWYTKNNPEKWLVGKNPTIYKARAGEFRLATPERKKILLNNIYGVDIDTQAVEVTKLSLLLKVLEGENEQTIAQQLKLFHERALPDLGNNIKCGNSLIGSDFYEGTQVGLFEDEEKFRINAFDWDGNDGFQEIMKNGGFDVVIGNPPYVFGRDWKSLGISDEVKGYLGSKFKSVPYQLDMFSIFIEKASLLCKQNGKIGQIVPNVWLNNIYSASTRSYILQNSEDLVISVPTQNVFPGLTVDTIIYTLSKTAIAGKTFSITDLQPNGTAKIEKCEVSQYIDGESPISTSINNKTRFILRIDKSCPKLNEFAKITRGVHPYRIGGYGQSAFGKGVQTEKDCEERPYNSSKPKKDYRPFIYGRDLKRYTQPIPNDYIKYGPWLAEPRHPGFFDGERIYTRKILGPRFVVTIDKSNSVADQQVYITKPISQKYSLEYLAGILGSKFISFYIKTFYNEADDAFPQIKIKQLQNLPIPNADKSLHDCIANCVTSIFEINQRIPLAKTAQEKTILQRQIDSTDRRIDELVYELYGLTEEEIKIVEGTNEGK